MTMTKGLGEKPMSRSSHGHPEDPHVHHAAHELMVSEVRVKKHESLSNFLSTITTGLTKEVLLTHGDLLVEKSETTEFDTAQTKAATATDTVFSVNSSWIRGISTRKEDRDEATITTPSQNIEVGDDLAKATSKWASLLLN